jgi:hypothetical protein
VGLTSWSREKSCVRFWMPCCREWRILVCRLRLQSCLDFGMRRWMACELRQASLMKGVKARERHHI